MNIEIENREVKVGDTDRVFAMVDLIIDGNKIETGENPITSFSFWEDMNQASERALYRIKKNNPKQKFDFNLGTMGLTEAQKDERFTDFLKSQHPDMNVDEILVVVNEELGKLELTGPDDDHPNPEMKFPINSHIVKRIIFSIIRELNELNKIKENGK